MFVRIRILPILIVVASMMLMTKVSTFLFRITEPDASQGLFYSAGAKDPLAPQASVPSVVPTLAQANGEAESGTPEIIQPSIGDSDALRPLDLTQGEDFDPSSGGISPSEIRLLHNLSDRRRRIVDLEKELIERESLLRAAERQLEDKQRKLNDIKAEINQLISRYDKQKEQENARLRLIYSNMKPKAAAAIFNNLDVETLIGVLQDMSPRVVAPMIAEMDVEMARQLTQELAERRAIDRLALE